MSIITDFKHDRVIVLVISFLCVVLIAFGLIIRMGDAYSTTSTINSDENIYGSTIDTYLKTGNVSEAIMGYPPMRVHPARGLGFHIYTALVSQFGFNIFMLRTVSAVMAFIAVSGIYALARLLYDPMTALISAGVASVSVFVISTASIRFDAITMAHVAWGSVFVVYALKRRMPKWVDVLIGLYMGLGLQMHIDTLFLAFACGLLYLFEDIQHRRQGQRVWFRSLNYAFGYSLGLGLFVVYNILPDSETFFTLLFGIRSLSSTTDTTVQNENSSSIVTMVVQLLFSPIEWLNRFFIWSVSIAKYGSFLELILVLLALIALVWRRFRQDNYLRILVFGSILCALIVAKSYHFVYLTHLAPPIIVAVGVFISKGFGKQFYPITVFWLLALLSFSLFSHQRSFQKAILVAQGNIQFPATNDAVEYVYQHATPDSLVAGPINYYVPYFYDRDYEYIAINKEAYLRAMILFEITDVVKYWQYKDPDFVIVQIDEANPTIDINMLQFVQQNNYIQQTPTLWIKKLPVAEH